MSRINVLKAQIAKAEKAGEVGEEIGVKRDA